MNLNNNNSSNLNNVNDTDTGTNALPHGAVEYKHRFPVRIDLDSESDQGKVFQSEESVHRVMEAL